MQVNELKSIIEPYLIQHVKNLYSELEARRLKIIDKNKVGFGNYILINKLQNQFVIELLGFQRISKEPKFSVEYKSCSDNINYFINGGRKIVDYHNFNPIANRIGNNCHLGNLIFSTLKDRDELVRIFDEITVNSPFFYGKDMDLPLIFKSDVTNVVLKDIMIFSKTNNQFSFRNHSTTIIINENMSSSDFKIILPTIFNINKTRTGHGSFRLTLIFNLISELKSMAYHKVHETTIDKFLQLSSDLFARALGYKSARSNIKLELQVKKEDFNKKKELIPDFMLEREDGYFDILDLKTGLLSYDFALGNWSNARFSSYGQKLLGQLKGYERYFSFEKNSDWALNKYNIKVKNPKLIGVAGNHNNFNHKIVKLALENHSDDFVLYSYNDLAFKMRNNIN